MLIFISPLLGLTVDSNVFQSFSPSTSTLGYPNPVGQGYSQANPPTPSGSDNVSRQMHSSCAVHPTVHPDFFQGFPPPTSTHTSSIMPSYRIEQKPCGWKGADGNICGKMIDSNCQNHFVVHGIVNLPANVIVTCGWCMSDNKMTRGSILRHIREVHLGIPRQKRT